MDKPEPFVIAAEFEVVDKHMKAGKMYIVNNIGEPFADAQELDPWCQVSFTAIDTLETGSTPSSATEKTDMQQKIDSLMDTIEELKRKLEEERSLTRSTIKLTTFSDDSDEADREGDNHDDDYIDTDAESDANDSGSTITYSADYIDMLRNKVEVL